MAKLCTNCGREIAEGVAFCTECGTKAPADTPQEAQRPQETAAEQTIQAPNPQTAAQPTPEAPGEQAAPAQTAFTPPPQAEPPIQPQPTVRQPAPAVDAPPAGKYGVVGTGYFFGMMFLYAIPVIGWLICLITAFAARNENKKHFAKAMLIWLIIGLVLAVVGYFVFRWLGGMLTDYINAEFGGQFGDLQELLEQFKQFENGGLIPPTE